MYINIIVGNSIKLITFTSYRYRHNANKPSSLSFWASSSFFSFSFSALLSFPFPFPFAEDFGFGGCEEIRAKCVPFHHLLFKTHTHTHIRVIAFDRGCTMDDVCVSVCECVSVHVCNCITVLQYRGDKTRTLPIKRGRIFWQLRTYTLYL